MNERQFEAYVIETLTSGAFIVSMSQYMGGLPWACWGTGLAWMAAIGLWRAQEIAACVPCESCGAPVATDLLECACCLPEPRSLQGFKRAA